MRETTPESPEPVAAVTKAVCERSDKLRSLIQDQHESLMAIAKGIHGGHEQQMTPSSIVHEAYLRLVDQSKVVAGSKTFFRACFAQECRRILVDHARKRKALRRGGGQTSVSLSDHHSPNDPGEFEVIAVHEAIEALAKLDERLARIVDLRVFGGLTVVECAAELGVSPRTVDTDWAFARSWLQRQLG